MKKLSLAIFLAVGAGLLSPLPPIEAVEIDVEIGLETGYRQDELNWTEGEGLLGLVGWKSKLTWEDLDIWYSMLDGAVLLDLGGLRMSGEERLQIGIQLQGSFGYGWILDGTGWDSDYYILLGQELEFSRSKADVEGDVLDGELDIGCQIAMRIPPQICKRSYFCVTPRVGYSYSEQNLENKNLYQKIPNLGKIYSGSVITYDTQWYGPFIGFDIAFKTTNLFKLFFSYEYHWADYDGDANWKLRDDLAHPKSFEHTADGDGTVISFGGDYFLTDNWLLNGSVNFQDWSTDQGTDKTYFADGTSTDIPLHEVNWDSWSTMLGASYRF